MEEFLKGKALLHINAKNELIYTLEFLEMKGISLKVDFYDCMDYPYILLKKIDNDYVLFQYEYETECEENIPCLEFEKAFDFSSITC